MTLASATRITAAFRKCRGRVTGETDARAAAENHGMKSILDRTFRHVPSHETDVRKTLERPSSVVQLPREKKSA